jgi:tRNA modification GTPase
MRDTVFALATAPGRAAVAIVRLSGPGAGTALDRLTGGRPPPRRAAVRTLRDPANGEAVDEALVLWLPGPGSFTGEDLAELHLHGGRAVVEAVVARLADLGLRTAEPGEFTRRAFEAGRLDLAQAEAIADLVDADTPMQRRQALAQLDGRLGERYDRWRLALVDILALLEASIDFPDEEIPPDLLDAALAPIRELRGDMAAALADTRGERVREGYRIALVGAPNAGKSTLFNRLVGREAAIVTPLAGTTRDVIEATAVLSGYPVVLADMAGLRATGDLVEAEGVRRARAWAGGASLRLFIVDRSGDDGDWREGAELLGPGDLVLLNKADLPAGSAAPAVRGWADAAGIERLEVAAADAASIEALHLVLEARVVAALGGAEAPAVTRQRHRDLLAAALEQVDRGLSNPSAGPELIAENLRLAGRELERISGRIDPEDVLDRVFAKFCIGK